MRGVDLVAGDKLHMLWLDNGLAMNHRLWDDLDINPAGPPTNLGGAFSSPPVGCVTRQDRLHVFALGLDYAVYTKVHSTGGLVGHEWSTPWQSLGGNLTSSPIVVSPAENRMDLFGVDADRGMVHRTWHASARSDITSLGDPGTWTDWEELGGGFTSRPAILPSASGTFDIFARGLDFMIYHAVWQGPGPAAWEILGGGLLGETPAASAPAAVRAEQDVFVFAAGEDGAMWYIRFDGTVWKPWVSLGPAYGPTRDADPITFTSEPVVASFFPASDITPVVGTTGTATTGEPGARAETGSGPPSPPPPVRGHARVDVFAVGSDTQLWHRWLDHAGWHGENRGHGETGNWDLRGGSFACAPALVVQSHARSPIAPPPVRFTMLTPQTDGTAHRWWFDGSVWNAPEDADPQHVFRPHFRLPSYYRFSVDQMLIEQIMSESSDTDVCTVVLKVGDWPVLTKKLTADPVLQRGTPVEDEQTGQVVPYNGIWSFGDSLTFDPVVVEPCEPVAFVYSIVNTGNPDAVASVVEQGMQAGVNAGVKALVTMAAPSILGSIAGAVAGGAFGAFLDWLLTSCDGTVAAETVAFQKGRDLQDRMALHGANGALVRPTEFLADSVSQGPLCSQSRYTVQTTIAEVL